MRDKHPYNNNILSNIDKYVEFISFCRFYPDLALDFFRVDNGGATIYLGYDQRIFMRCKARFKSMYGVFSRGYSKTFLEVLTEVLMCIFYPSRDAALSAQTKENAANILQAKWKEIIKYFPLIENEAEKVTFSKNDAFIKFKNGSTYRVLANAQSSKGSRSCAISIEEAALLDDEILKDAMLPIIEVPRMLVGKKHIANPCEFNTLGYFTTPIFRGSDDFNRCVSMLNNMSELNGSFAIGASWILPSYFNRGSTKKQIIEKAKDYSPVEFAWNYLSKYTGSSAGALIAMNKLMKCRNLLYAEHEAEKDGEYYIAVDVARSQYDSNNKSSITVGKVIRNEKNKIQNIQLVNIFNISNTLNFTSQAVIIKETKLKYNAKMVIVDGNGLNLAPCRRNAA